VGDLWGEGCNRPPPQIAAGPKSCNATNASSAQKMHNFSYLSVKHSRNALKVLNLYFGLIRGSECRLFVIVVNVEIRYKGIMVNSYLGSVLPVPQLDLNRLLIICYDEVLSG